MKLSVGERIFPAYWNKNKCRAKETRSFAQHSEFNSKLETLENITFNVYRRLINDGIFPTPTQLKAEVIKESYLSNTGRAGNINKIGFFDFIRKIIGESESGVRLTSKGTKYSNFTIKGYITTLNHLEDFQRYLNTRIDFDSINMDFYHSLVNWFYSQGKAKNTVGKQIKNLKVFMIEALDRGFTTNTAFRSKKFKVLEEDSDTIYLSDEELDRIQDLNLSHSPNLELARDNFILDCYIGLRIADFNNLTKEHIIDVQGIKMISIIMQKTENPVKIPLHKNALQILEKCNYNIKTLSDQAMNRLIKQIGKLAEINDEIFTTITRGGKRVVIAHKKYEKITNHTARRSFATNLYYADVPNLAIMKMTGHKTEKSFLKYIRINEEENAIKLSQHPYFSS